MYKRSGLVRYAKQAYNAATQVDQRRYNAQSKLYTLGLKNNITLNSMQQDIVQYESYDVPLPLCKSPSMHTWSLLVSIILCSTAVPVISSRQASSVSQKKASTARLQKKPSACHAPRKRNTIIGIATGFVGLVVVVIVSICIFRKTKTHVIGKEIQPLRADSQRQHEQHKSSSRQDNETHVIGKEIQRRRAAWLQQHKANKSSFGAPYESYYNALISLFQLNKKEEVIIVPGTIAALFNKIQNEDLAKALGNAQIPFPRKDIRKFYINGLVSYYAVAYGNLDDVRALVAKKAFVAGPGEFEAIAKKQDADMANLFRVSHK